MNFPTIVYKCPGEHHCGTGGMTYKYVGVADQEAFDAKLADGWSATLVEAMGGAPVDNSPPTREELEIKARELGLKFDGRTTDAKLGRMIAEALEA